jgi:hypothetical protein
MHLQRGTCGEVILCAKLVKADSAVDSDAPREQDYARQHLHIQLHREERRILRAESPFTWRSADSLLLTVHRGQAQGGGLTKKLLLGISGQPHSPWLLAGC